MSNNKTRGNRSEGSLIKRLAAFFGLTTYNPRLKNIEEANIGSTRLFNQSLDARNKIDIWFKEPDKYPFAIQVKKQLVTGKGTTSIRIESLSQIQPINSNDFKILAVEMTRKAKVREVSQGWVYVIDDRTFGEFLKLWKNENK